MKQIQTNKIKWKEVEIGELLDYEQPGKYIVEGEIHKSETKNSVPVLTANKSFILGYTEEKEGVYTKSPVIIFDDFTTDIKFVDFKFKVKSSAMKLLTSKSKDVDLKFIFLMMKSINVNFSTHKRYYLSVYQKRNIPIPFSDGKPDLAEQERIVKILEESERLNQRGKKAEELLDEFLKSVFSEMFLKENLSSLEIGRGILKANKINPEVEFKDKTFKYVDIASIDNNLKKIFDVKDIPGEEAPSRARQLIKRGDVLISTVRPNLNAVAVVPKELDNQVCSTGFCILRADNKNFISEYLFFISKQRFFIDKLIKKCRGANYPAVSNKDVISLDIPLPPFPLQKKFASTVEQVEKMKEKINNTKQNSEELFNSFMSKAFKGEL